MSSLVAVSAKWNPRFGLIDTLHHNMHKRAQGDHQYHSLSFTWVLAPGPVGLVGDILPHLALILTDVPRCHLSTPLPRYGTAIDNFVFWVYLLTLAVGGLCGGCPNLDRFFQNVSRPGP